MLADNGMVFTTLPAPQRGVHSSRKRAACRRCRRWLRVHRRCC